MVGLLRIAVMVCSVPFNGRLVPPLPAKTL
jgi:hypothetical protein